MRLHLDARSQMHAVSIQKALESMYFYRNVHKEQSLPLGYQRLLLMLSLTSLHMLASHRSGRSDACGTGTS